MPTYTFKNKNTDDEFDIVCSYDDLINIHLKNPTIEQIIKAPGFADPTRLGLHKPESEFRDLLKKIKKQNIGSNIDTW